VLVALALIWLVLSWFLDSPRYLSTLTVELADIQTHPNVWSQQLLELQGIEEVVILKNQGIAYVKIDTKTMTDDERQKLSSLLNQPVAFS
jgi:hypothetical protein